MRDRYSESVDTLTDLRATVTLLMRAAHDTQTTLAAALRLTQGQVSRKQTGHSEWTLPDCDRLAAHYGITVPELLSGRHTALNAAHQGIQARLLAGTR